VRSESYNSVIIFYLDKELIEHNLKESILKLSTLPGIKKVILFGSLANGRAVPGSDCDILVLMKGYDNCSIFEKVEIIQPFFSDIGIACDIFPYNEDDLTVPLAKQALNSGIIIFDNGSCPDFHLE